jgi:chromosome segregation ATPase
MPRHVHFTRICSTVIETSTDTNTTRISPQTTMQRDTDIERLEKKVEELTRELGEKTRVADEATTKLSAANARIQSLEARCEKTTSDYCALYDEYDYLAARVNELAIEAHDDRQSSKATAATLQDSLDRQTETSRRLQTAYDELEASQLETVEELEEMSVDVTNLEQARAHLLQFMYTAIARPGTTIEEFVGERASIVERTKHHLRVLEYAWDKTERMHKAVSNQLVKEQADVGRLLAAAEQRGEACQEYMGIAATLREQLTAADDLLTGRDNHIATLTADVAARNARIEALSSAQQTALEEHLRVAVDLEKLKISHSALKRFVEEIIRDEDPDAS